MYIWYDEIQRLSTTAFVKCVRKSLSRHATQLAHRKLFPPTSRLHGAGFRGLPACLKHDEALPKRSFFMGLRVKN